jgi:hypothetical protein
MIALVENKSGLNGKIKITLYQNKDKSLANAQRGYLEHVHRLDNDISIFILEAESIEQLLKTHGSWFAKLRE